MIKRFSLHTLLVLPSLFFLIKSQSMNDLQTTNQADNEILLTSISNNQSPILQGESLSTVEGANELPLISNQQQNDSSSDNPELISISPSPESRIEAETPLPINPPGLVTIQDSSPQPIEEVNQPEMLIPNTEIQVMSPISSTSSAGSQSSSTQIGGTTLLTSESEALSISNNGFSATSIAKGLAIANNKGITTEAIASTVGDPFSLILEQDYAYNLHTLYSDDKIFNQTNFSSNSYTAMDFNGMLRSYREAMRETLLSKDFQNGVVHDAEYQYAKIQTGTEVLGGLETSNMRDIVIEFDVSKQKVLVERIITNESKIMVVSAATNLLTSLIKEDQDYLEKLYNAKCSCKLIKDFLIELLKESA